MMPEVTWVDVFPTGLVPIPGADASPDAYFTAVFLFFCKVLVATVPL